MEHDGDVEISHEPVPPTQHADRKDLLGKTFLNVYHIFCRVVCVSTLVVQCVLIDYYLVAYNSPLWSLWVIADIAVIVLFLAMFVVSYLHLKRRELFVFPALLGELPLTYMSWFIYAAVLSAKICIIYTPPGSIALQLKEVNFFGPNMLRTAVSLSCFILYLVVLTSHDTRSKSIPNEFIVAIVGSAYIDLLDTSQFTDTLRNETQTIVKHGLHYPTIAVICFNFILPTAALFILSKKHFGKIHVAARFQMFLKVSYFMTANVPIFVIRMLIWHVEDQNISVFLMKNVLAIGLAIKDIHEFSQEVGDVIKDELNMPDYEFEMYYGAETNNSPQQTDGKDDACRTTFIVKK